MEGIVYPKYLKINHDAPVEANIELINKALLKHPEDEYQLKTILASFYWRTPSLHDKCIELCDEIIIKSNNNNLNIEAYFFSAVLFEQDKKDLPEAIRRYELILKIDSCDDAALRALFEINFDKKNYEEARKYAERLSIVEDCEYLGFCYLGNIARALKDYDTAIAYYKTSVENCEDCDYEPSYFIAICYVEKNEIDKAIEILKQALQLYPEEANLYYGLGLCLQKKDDFYRALDNYTKALKIDPKFPEAYNNIANLFLDYEGDFKKAAEYLEKALEVVDNAVNPNNVLYFMNLYKLYKSMHDDNKAEYYNKKYLACMGFDDLFTESDDEEDEM